MFRFESNGIVFVRPSATVVQLASGVWPTTCAALTASWSAVAAAAFVYAELLTPTWYSSGGCTVLMSYPPFGSAVALLTQNRASAWSTGQPCRCSQLVSPVA